MVPHRLVKQAVVVVVKAVGLLYPAPGESYASPAEAFVHAHGDFWTPMLGLGKACLTSKVPSCAEPPSDVEESEELLAIQR